MSASSIGESKPGGSPSPASENSGRFASAKGSKYAISAAVAGDSIVIVGRGDINIERSSGVGLMRGGGLAGAAVTFVGVSKALPVSRPRPDNASDTASLPPGCPASSATMMCCANATG